MRHPKITQHLKEAGKTTQDEKSNQLTETDPEQIEMLE